jgi:hypothetical protein
LLLDDNPPYQRTMKITGETTFAELMLERARLGIEYLGLNFNRPTQSWTGIVLGHVPGYGLKTIFGHGNTEADAINAAFDELHTRQLEGVGKEKSSDEKPPTASGG